MTSAIPHTEKAFEQLIVAEMTGAGGWEAGDPADYDAELGLYPDDAITFAITPAVQELGPPREALRRRRRRSLGVAQATRRSA